MKKSIKWLVVLSVILVVFTIYMLFIKKDYKEADIDYSKMDYEIVTDNNNCLDIKEAIFIDEVYAYYLTNNCKTSINFKNGKIFTLEEVLKSNILSLDILIKNGLNVDKEELNKKEYFQDLIDNYLKLSGILETQMIRPETFVTDEEYENKKNIDYYEGPIVFDNLKNIYKIDLFFNWYTYTGENFVDEKTIDEYLKKYYDISVKHDYYNRTFEGMDVNYLKNDKKYSVSVLLTSNAILAKRINICNSIYNISKDNNQYKVYVKRVFMDYNNNKYLLTDGFNNLEGIETFSSITKNKENVKEYLKDHDNMLKYIYTFKYVNGNYVLKEYDLIK